MLSEIWCNMQIPSQLQRVRSAGREWYAERPSGQSAVSMSWPLEPEYIWTSTGVPTNRTSALDRITRDGEVSSTGIRAFGIDNGARAIKLYDWYPILSHENKYHSKSFILYSLSLSSSSKIRIKNVSYFKKYFQLKLLPVQLFLDYIFF